jgi:hypothetical protein
MFAHDYYLEHVTRDRLQRFRAEAENDRLAERAKSARRPKPHQSRAPRLPARWTLRLSF